MSPAHLRKTALSVALLSMGLALSVMAQTPSTGTSGSTGATTSSSTSRNATAGTSGTAGMSGSTGTSSGSMAVSRGASDAKLGHGDKKFVEDAAQGGMAEVQFGQLAAQKAQNPEVKQFGQKMVDDHSKANDQLKSIASSKGVDLPTDLKGADKREHDRLSKLNGADFDREYMKHMVSDHKKDVSDFQKEAKSGKDADVKTFASTTLPTLQQHLQLAQQADASVRSASRSGSTMSTSSKAGSPGSSMGATGGTGGTTPSSNTTPPKKSGT
jgi:putative membrane protein